ncbi:thyrotropin-releasing hormone receptor-like [Orcinus orca]|uniref:thyrotropin-releasing hormone receptor-like n=1 Tax=Orcinus orca TaxID=9733 RepID=UPI002112408F|nr:thyrotropin-releasing hormone receptor-like [Orcinus orca]
MSLTPQPRPQAVCIVAGVWGTTSVYCLLWFFLVALDADGHREPQPVPAHLPAGLHRLLCYALLEATVLCSLIGRVLFQNSPAHLPQLGDQLGGQHGGDEDRPEPGTQGRQLRGPGGVQRAAAPGPEAPLLPGSRSPRCWWSRATLCRPVDALPHTGAPLLLCGLAFPGPRGLLFCRTCVYTNSAISPVIYSLTSPKFRLPSSGCAGAGWRSQRGARLVSAPLATAWTPEDADPRE